jgi:hypothetical protein
MGDDERLVLSRDHVLFMHRVKRGTTPLEEDGLVELGAEAQERLFPE